MNPIDLRPKASGRYTFEVVNKHTGHVRKLTEKADNLLLESFFREAVSEIGNGGWMSNIVVGTGSTPPVVTDTTLEGFIASTSTSQGGQISNIVNSTVYPRYVTRAIKKRFNGAAIANTPLSEVGVAITPSIGTNANATHPLASRALIVDALGNPTSITVLADEFLDVTYELTTYALDGVTGSFNINILGTVETFEYEIRPIGMLGSPWDTPASQGGVYAMIARSFASASGTASRASQAQDTAVFEDPSSSSSGSTGTSDLFTTYKSDPVWDASTMTGSGVLNLPLNNGNHEEGIRSFLLNFMGGSTNGGQILGNHRMMLDRPLMKTSDHVFEFPITLGLSNATPPGV